MALLKETESVVETSANTRPHNPDELARTAALLIDTVKSETNPKFKNSAFMGLMRQLRDGEVVVEGNDMVQRSDTTGGVEAPMNTKGKGRAVDIPAANIIQLPAIARPITVNPIGATTTAREQTYDEDGVLRGEDPNDAYFRRENEDYIAMQQGLANNMRQGQATRMGPQAAEWDALQRDWDAFEATAYGLRPLSNYQFQANNPYLSGEASRTKHHTSHSGLSETLYEVRRPRPVPRPQLLISCAR